MNGPLYWKGQLPVILLQLAAMVGLALLLLLGGMNGDSVALILLLWALVAALWLVRGYVLRKRSWRPCWNWPASCRRPTCWGK